MAVAAVVVVVIVVGQCRSTGGKAYANTRTRRHYIRADRVHATLQRAMLVLSCCHRRCSDLVTANGASGAACLYTHTGAWDCTEYRRKTKQCVNGRGPGKGTAVVKDQFYDHFRMLPIEVKTACLAQCSFHVLANPELWLRDVDELFFKRIMFDEHVINPPCSWCDNVQALDLNMRQADVRIGLPTPHHGPYVFQPAESLTPLERFRLQPQDSVFGDANRYPCFYYRRCSHFDNTVTKRQQPTHALDRWTRLYGSVVSSIPLDASALALLDMMAPIRVKYMEDAKGPKRTRCRGLVVDVANTPVAPGLYYFELINYAWEDAMSAIDGVESRQRHFFLDPTSHVPSNNTRPLRFGMSLLFRRVCHPNSETDDHYKTIGYFERKPPSFRGGAEEGRRTHVYLDLARHPYEMGETVYIQQMVYRHVLTPSFDVRVYRSVDSRTRKNIMYYRVSLPHNVKPHSIDRNEHTIRLNMFVDVASMSLEERAAFGVLLVTAVNGKVDKGYAFKTSDTATMAFNHLEACAVFNLFYT